MTVKTLKTELYKLIDDIEDKSLLHLIKNEIQSYTSTDGADILDSLTESQVKALQVSIDEARSKDIISLKGFKKLAEQWRIR